MTTYELETGTIGFLEIRPNFFKSRILETINELEIVYGDVVFGHEYDYFKLPAGKWNELGIFYQLKEEDVKEVMPTIHSGTYVNYNKKTRSSKDHDWDFYCDTALEAIHSLAQYLGLDTTQPIFVIFKPR